MHRLRSMFFTNWHCYLIISHYCHVKWYLLRIRLFLVRGSGAENIGGKIKTGRRKTSKNDDKEKRRIQGKSNNNNKHLWFYLFVKNVCSLYHHISFSVFMRCRIFQTQ